MYNQFMKKIWSIMISILWMFHFITPIYASTESTFQVYASVYDYGARVDKIVIEYPETIDSQSVDLDDFYVVSNNTSNTSTTYINGARIISNAYVSDKSSGKEASTGKFVILELLTNRYTDYADVLSYDSENLNNVCMDINYIVEQTGEIENTKGNKIHYTYTQGDFIVNGVNEFGKGESTSGIHYRDYEPEDDDQLHPLVVFLHGAGSGGSDNITQLLTSKAGIAFMNNEILDDPYVLVPQCPDFWMPTLTLGTTVYTGKDRTEELVSCIREYIKEHPNVDTSRVYIGGYSMGGYQTWETLFAAPDLFAAAFPICAAYEVPQDQLDMVKDIPIWIIHSANDTTIPVTYSENAYAYLQSIGANVTFTEYENVIVDGEEYDGHSSWIYVLNNDPQNEEGQTIFEWLSNQHLKVATKKTEKEKEEVEDDKVDIFSTLIKILIGFFILFMILWIRRTIIIYQRRKRKRRRR